jgi:hypothetical protein
LDKRRVGVAFEGIAVQVEVGIEEFVRVLIAQTIQFV